MEDCVKCYYTRRLNIHHTVLYYSTGKLAPEKVIVVIPLDSRASEKRREQGVFPLGFTILEDCFLNI